MKKIINKYPNLIGKFANIVFVLGVICSVLIIIYAIYRIYQPYEINFSRFKVDLKFYYLTIIVSGISAILFAFGLRLNDGLKINLSVLFIAIGMTVYAFETYLEIIKKAWLPDFMPKYYKNTLAEKMGIPYDIRTEMKVINDLNESGVKAYLNNQPYFLIHSDGLHSTNGKIFPLGGISNITTILSNESGYFPIIETDEHGFNNPKGLYKKNTVDIMLTGDSFAEGYSVHSNENISAVLRSLGFNTISIGKNHNAPLIKLATLKEYAEPLQPKVVLWLYFANDVDLALKREMFSSFLLKYLNQDNFSQNLISRQAEIDNVLVNSAQEDWVKKRKEREDYGKKIRDYNLKNWPIRIIKLYNIRKMFKFIPKSNSMNLPEWVIFKKEIEQERIVFKKILEKSKKIVNGWGGKIYLVYLPLFENYASKGKDSEVEFVLNTTTMLNIPIIDMHKEVFSKHSDPLSLFPFRMGGHYNAEGYRLVTETISNRLKNDGFSY